MPRYSKRPRAKKFKPLRSLHQHAFFLGRLEPEHWTQIQEMAKTQKSPRVYAGAFADIANHDRRAVMVGIHAEHKAKKRGELVGGGLTDALSHIGSEIWHAGEEIFRPVVGAWNLASNISHAIFHENTISEHTNKVATAISESYEMDPNTRADYVGDLTRDRGLTTDYLDVWVDEDRQPPYALITVRGSVTPEDWLVNDAQILVTGSTRNLIGADLRRAVDKYADQGTVEIASHSLGTSLVARALDEDNQLQAKVDKMDFFNPASTPLTRSIVSEFGGDDKANFYMSMSDLVGFGTMMDTQPKHLVMTGPQLDPTKSHGLDQWINDNRSETGKLAK